MRERVGVVVGRLRLIDRKGVREVELATQPPGDLAASIVQVAQELLLDERPRARHSRR